MRDWLILGVGTLLFGLLALSGDTYLLRLGTMLAMYAVLAMSWNFIGGMTGYPSFATAAFFGLGAYTSAILQAAQMPMAVGWAAAGLVAGGFALLIGLPILRLKGHYFAIASLSIGEILREVVNTSEEITGGGMGMNLPLLRLPPEVQAQAFYLCMLGLAVLTTAVAILVHHGRLGFAFRCIEQNEDAATVLGVDTRTFKTAAFGLSAVFSGVAGAIYGNWVHYIEPLDVFDIMHSVKPLVMVLLGGLGTLFGPIFGAIVFLALEEAVWRNFLGVHAAVLGVLIVAMVLFLPRGLATSFEQIARRFRGKAA